MLQRSMELRRWPFLALVLAGVCLSLAGELRSEEAASTLVPDAIRPLQPTDIRWQSGVVDLKRQWDPVASTLSEQVSLAMAEPSGLQHVVVQFDRPVTAELRSQMMSDGLELLSPLGRGTNAFFASVTGQTDAEVLLREQSFQAIVPIELEWKLHPAIIEHRVWSKVSKEHTDNPTVAVYVLLHRDVPLQDGNILAVVHGATLVSSVSSTHTLVLEIPESNLLALASEDAVQYVEPALPQMEPINQDVRDITQVDEAQDVLGLDGSGVNVLVFDGGRIDAHPDLAGRVRYGDADTVSSHATHVACTIGGNGSNSSGVHRGMAPGVSIQSFGLQYEFPTTFLYTDPADIENDYASAIANGAVLANNSIGTNTCNNGFSFPDYFPCDITGDYGNTALLIDTIVRGGLGSPMRIVWANGNERGCDRCVNAGGADSMGYHSTAPPGGAKNHITVGALNKSTSDPASSTSSWFSSWGPVDDGRLKPDISAPGVDVTSCYLFGDYTTASGTSMAAPAVTGLLSLLLEDFRIQFPGEDDPTNAMLKALLTHNALDIENPGPDYKSGYGLVQIVDTIEFMREGRMLNGEIDQSGSVNVHIDVLADSVPLKATLAWDDFPGTPNVIPSLVNDLDLRIYGPDGSVYLPWTLDPDLPFKDAARVVVDRVNNLEQVQVDQPEAGIWRIEIRGYNVPEGPQLYSLVYSHDALLNDCDNDGLSDDCELCTSNCPPGCGGSMDCNANGLPDECEDCNENQLADECDLNAGTSSDCNHNLIPDECDVDCEASGSPDDCDLEVGSAVDCNGNRIPDLCDVLSGHYEDCDGNQVVDECELEGEAAVLTVRVQADDRWWETYWYLLDEYGQLVHPGGFLGSMELRENTLPLRSGHCYTFYIVDYGEDGICCDHGSGFYEVYYNDVLVGSGSDFGYFAVIGEIGDCNGGSDCNNTGILDACEIRDGLSDDCNDNARPDECDVQDGLSEDCNDNGQPDECDVASGMSHDCNTNLVPDDCEPDCNANGQADECDLADQVSQDCNGNDVPDECDVGGSSEDVIDLVLNGHFVNDLAGWTLDYSIAGIVELDDGTPGPWSEGCFKPVHPIPYESNSLRMHITDFADDSLHYASISQWVNIPALPVGTNPLLLPTLSWKDRMCIESGTFSATERFVVEALPDGETIPTVLYQTLPGDPIQSNYWKSRSVSMAAFAGMNDVRITFRIESDDVAVDLRLDDIQLRHGIGLSGTSDDCNDNRVPDECEEDCNGNGKPDACDITEGTSTDCNANGIADDCEWTDCNGSGVHDSCDIQYGLSRDINADGIPDECDDDCDHNGIPDVCQFDCEAPVPGNEGFSCGELYPQCGQGPDVNDNGILDECENPCRCDVSGTAPGGGCTDEEDCDHNGVLDSCDLSRSNATDCNLDVVLDECQLGTLGDADGDLLPDGIDTDVPPDGVPDVCDLCPNNPLKVEPGDCGCDLSDFDFDQDGTPDCQDQCPYDDQKVTSGVCGCGVFDVDSDGDNTYDCDDRCPDDPNKTAPGACGCGSIDDLEDEDNDGVRNCFDRCAATETSDVIDELGCSDVQVDTDGDGLCNPNAPSDGPLDCVGTDSCPRSDTASPTDIIDNKGCTDLDVDADLDGVCDPDAPSQGPSHCIGEDLCPVDPSKIVPGECGCGVPEGTCSTPGGGGGGGDTDGDGDGTPDSSDGCPADPGKTQPGVCGCGVADSDIDSDGTLDCNDDCPADVNKTVPGTCGCGVADTDSDEDGTFDCEDFCPNDPNKTSAGQCGCGESDVDTDGDGTADCRDLCVDDPNKQSPGRCGCGVLETDTDGDQSPDCVDGCPSDANKTDDGVCGCGVADTDSDDDGTADCNDECPQDVNKLVAGDCGCGNPDVDSDNDGTMNCNDDCPTDPGKTSAGVCGCGALETDTDGDSVPDCVDNCIQIPNTNQADGDGDGFGDACDSDGPAQPTDDDEDGVFNEDDVCPDTPASKVDQVDEQGCSPSQLGDDDGDGVVNGADQCPGTPAGEAVDASGCPMVCGNCGMGAGPAAMLMLLGLTVIKLGMTRRRRRS